MSKKSITALVIVIFTFTYTSLTKAQTSNSIYTMFGVGKTIDNSYGINKSLGGTGIAFQSGRTINQLNPASYLGFVPNSMIIELGAYGIFNTSKDENSSQTNSKFNVSYFSAGLYLAKWWAVSFGVTPYSYIDYIINTTDKIEGELSPFNKNYTGTGGLSQMSLGNSFRIFKNLACGFNAAYIFGVITETETAVANEEFTGYKLTTERRAGSLKLNYGLQYSFDKNQNTYTLGLIYGASKKLNTKDETEFSYNEYATALDEDDEIDIKIPQKFGVGIAVKKGSNFRAGFDYEFNNWSHINFSNENLETNNSHRFSLGMELYPRTRTSENWYEKLFYRFGANYKNSYVEIDNVQINSFGFNVGLGIPINGINMLNLALEYGKEGTTEHGLIENNYWGLYMNFSLYELWAVKSRRR